MPYRKHRFDFNILKEIDSPEKAYWIGFLIGDGCIPSKGYALKVEILRKDRDQLDRLFCFLKCDGYSIVETTKDCCLLIVNSKEFIQSIAKYGLVPRKTWTNKKRMGIPEKYIADYYRGFLDADGWICEHKLKKQEPGYEFGFCALNREFLVELQSWLSNKIGKDVGCLMYKNRTCASLIIGGINNFVKICDILYSTSTNESRMSRKYDLSRKFLKIIEQRNKN